jgi:hypothetical protein
MRRMLRCATLPVGVIQICWMAAGAGDVGEGEGFPGLDADGGGDLPAAAEFARAVGLPVPSVAMPPAPFSPVKFSGLIERVRAAESLLRLPRLRPRPLKELMK